MKQDLLKLMVAREGHFRFESGHHGKLWLELDSLFVHPERVRPLAVELAQHLMALRPEAVCGPLLGGAFLAQMIAEELKIEFYFTERDCYTEDGRVSYRLPKPFHSAVASKHIAVVDDVINAGSAVRKTLDVLRSCGATPVVVGSLLQLGSNAVELMARPQMPLAVLAQVPNELWVAEECPLCQAGIPLQD